VKPRVDVAGRELQVARHAGHQNGGDIAFSPIAIDRDQARRGYAGGMQEVEVSGFLLGQVRLILQPGEEEMPAEDQVEDGPIRNPNIDGMHRRRTSAAEAPDSDHLGARTDCGLDPAPRPSRRR
jgi:hypothetical protein